MKIRLVCSLSLFGAIAFASFACDSSSTPSDAGTDSSVTDSSVSDAAVDAAVDAGVDSGAYCVSPNQAYTADTLEANSNTSGSCADSADIAVVCANDLEARAATCALSSCAAYLIGMPEQLKSCITTCMAAVTPAPSTACLNCYSDSVVCTATSCLGACAVDPNAPDCISCRKLHECYTSFFSCSGLPNVTPQ